jgi:hypothetical protein
MGEAALLSAATRMVIVCATLCSHIVDEVEPVAQKGHNGDLYAMV